MEMAKSHGELLIDHLGDLHHEVLNPHIELLRELGVCESEVEAHLELIKRNCVKRICFLEILN